MEWVASTLHTTSEHGVSSITTADAHPPTDVNGLVRFTERRNLVSACVPSYFKRSLLASSLLNSRYSHVDVYLHFIMSTEKEDVRSA